MSRLYTIDERGIFWDNNNEVKVPNKYACGDSKTCASETGSNGINVKTYGSGWIRLIKA